VLLQTSKLLVITWQTNEPADGQIEYGTQQGVYSSSTEISPYLSTFHALTLSGLSPQTTYYFRIKSKDAKNNLGISQEYTASTTAEESKLIRETLYLGVSTEQYNQLKTEYEKTKEEAQKAKQESEKLKQELEKLQDKTPPEIYNIEIKNVQPFSATVCFKTNEPAIGIVQYGEEKGKYIYSVSEDDYLTSHCLELKRLKMGTKYYLRIIAIDKMGNKSIKTTK
jgi:glycyl-tRNA synthetase (class II)